MRTATKITLSPQETDVLKKIVHSPTAEVRQVFRANIILLSARGKRTKHIAKMLKTRPTTVSKWRKRFAQKWMDGLMDAERSGAPKIYDHQTMNRVLKILDKRPPQGFARWNGRLVAQALKDVSKHQVWRILNEKGISLERRHSWCISTDPEFTSKAADVVGIYLNPPENAVVISVDEKPSIQALERAQGYLKLPNGRAITGFAHEYKRHGTTTLFAALEVLTGKVWAAHYHRRRRMEFLNFMNQTITHFPGKEIHVVLDNLNTHKPKHDAWLKRHKNVHFHFTPTHASWLNQIECWFSILSRGALHSASFTSTEQVRNAIDKFIMAYNKQSAPFQWTKIHVKQQKFNNIAKLCN